MVVNVSALSRLERRVYLVILNGKVSAAGIARRLDVTAITAARAVASLRKRGIKIVSIRDPEGWYYEIRSVPRSMLKQWSETRLSRMAGFANGRPEREVSEEDRSIYGDAHELRDLAGRFR